jgi:hypothetical protein
MLQLLIQPAHIGLEWGVGESTGWFCQRAVKLYSIEHDKRWLDSVSAKLKSTPELFSKWSPRYEIADTAPVKDCIYRDRCNVSRRAYALAEGIPDNLNFILVDGRARAGCMATALRKLTIDGGILILDNSERARYFEAISSVSEHWQKYIFSNRLWQTTIWISAAPHVGAWIETN